MRFLLWYWYEGRPKEMMKNFIKGLHYRMEGEKHKRKALRELRKLERPIYKQTTV